MFYYIMHCVLRKSREPYEKKKIRRSHRSVQNRNRRNHRINTEGDLNNLNGHFFPSEHDWIDIIVSFKMSAIYINI